jgi:hypothetical protein
MRISLLQWAELPSRYDCSGSMLQQDEQRAVEMTLRRFTSRVERALFTEKERRRPWLRPSLLVEARELGIVADASRGSRLSGVWGSACRDEGLRRSLLAPPFWGGLRWFCRCVHAGDWPVLAWTDALRSHPRPL